MFDCLRSVAGPAMNAGGAVLMMSTGALRATPALDGPEAIGPFLNGHLPAVEPTGAAEWTVAETYQGIDINLPMHVMPYPGTDRLICVAKEGRIFTFDDDPAAGGTEVFLDLRGRTFTASDSGMTWIVFHPEFGEPDSPNRGYVYVTYKWAPPTGGNGVVAYWRLSRFTVPDGELAADPASELVMIQQYDRQWWHDSGCMSFGPDGFLYVGIGDEGGANDEYNVAQRVDERLFSGILRIDVDQDLSRSHPIRRQPAQIAMPTGWPDSFTAHYTIPNDNPFVDETGGTLEEFYAIGLRQPYRFSRDAQTGRTWIADSGQDGREEIDLLERGANYGWPFREGRVPGPRPQPAVIHGLLTGPVWDVSHATEPDGCVIGGFVYRGTKFPLLYGKYLAVDNVSGRIRAFTYDGTEATGTILTNMPSGSVYSGTSTIGWDHAGEPIFVKISGTGSRGRFFKLEQLSEPVANAGWFRFEDQAAENSAGFVSDNPHAATGNQVATGVRLLSVDDGETVSYAGANGVLPVGAAANEAGVRIPGGEGALETERPLGVLNDFTIELSLRPLAGSLGSGYQCFLGLDGTTGDAPDDGENGDPLQPFRLMRWGRDDAGATSIPLEDGDLYLNVRTADPETGQWSSVPVVVVGAEDFTEERWYHLAIVGDVAAGTVTVWGYDADGGGYTQLGQGSGYAGNLQGGIWSLGRGMHAGNPADWVDGADFDELRFSEETLTPDEFLYGTEVWQPRLNATELPPLLSQTGAFADVATLTPAQGVFPYTVNAPLWSDAAAKRRWIALPNDGSHDSPGEKIAFRPDGDWGFPAGTVLIKHFELAIDEADPTAVRRLETRFIVIPESGEPYGATYRWLLDGSDAELLPNGASDLVTIHELGGGTREQLWEYPSRTDCRICHNGNAGHVLGVRTQQLNGDLLYGRTGRTGNQLETLAALGWFDDGYRPEHRQWFLKSHALHETWVDAGERVRSYLDSNCAQCHRPGGVRANFDARYTTPLAAQGLVRGALESTVFDPGDRVIAPGDPGRSILLTRLVAEDGLQMPPIARHLVDDEAVAVISQWIMELPDAPVVTLDAPLSASGEFEVTVGFSAPVSGLAAEDFEITGAAVTAVAGSGSDYTLTVAPNGFGRVSLRLPAGRVVGAEGEENFESAAVETVISESGLATWLKLNEGSGVLAHDSSGAGNDAVFTGMDEGAWVAGIHGGALLFDDTSQRLTLENVAPDDFTIAFWMRTTQAFPVTDVASSGKVIFHADVPGAANDMIVAGTRSAEGIDRITFHTGHADSSPNTFAHGGTAVSTGGWVHVAVTRRQADGLMRVYIDGVLDGMATGGSDSLDASAVLAIGGNPEGADRSYAGELDQIRIYHRVLESAEIVELVSESGDVPTYLDWAGARMPGLSHLQRPTLDAEGDGRSNFAEYAFGGDPLGRDVSTTPLVPVEQGGMELSYVRRREPSGLEYRVLVGDDLTGWVDAVDRISEVRVEPLADADYERATVIFQPGPTDDRLFFKVEALER